MGSYAITFRAVAVDVKEISLRLLNKYKLPNDEMRRFLPACCSRIGIGLNLTNAEAVVLLVNVFRDSLDNVFLRSLISHRCKRGIVVEEILVLR